MSSSKELYSMHDLPSQVVTATECKDNDFYKTERLSNSKDSLSISQRVGEQAHLGYRRLFSRALATPPTTTKMRDGTYSQNSACSESRSEGEKLIADRRAKCKSTTITRQTTAPIPMAR